LNKKTESARKMAICGRAPLHQIARHSAADNFIVLKKAEDLSPYKKAEEDFRIISRIGPVIFKKL